MENRRAHERNRRHSYTEELYFSERLQTAEGLSGASLKGHVKGSGGSSNEQ